MVVGETKGTAVEAIEMRRLDDRVAVTAEFPIALIVGEHEDHVGPSTAPIGNLLVKPFRGNRLHPSQDKKSLWSR